MNRILAADVGGTKTHLAVLEVSSGELNLVREARLENRDFDGLGPLLEEFMGPGACRGLTAAVGLAGPVTGRRVRLTNLPWEVDADALESGLGLDHAMLLNDLEATAWAVPWLREDQIVPVVAGRARPGGAVAVVAAGTGLGQAGLVWHRGEPVPFATEGGHTTFAPVDEEQEALRRFLAARHEHVSWERVVSGTALPDLAEFVFARSGDDLETLTGGPTGGDLAEALTAEAGRNPDGPCGQVVRLFARCYGAVAGDAALAHLATGGVYLAGGVAPEVLWALKEPGFLEAFQAKGRMRGLLEEIPVALISDGLAPVYGAARAAIRAWSPIC